jgi:5-methylcytosine-specific restriction enzyme subunit McrC
MVRDCFMSPPHQQTSGGMIDGHALLFEMNVLFEQYVARVLSQALAGSGLRVSAQGGHRDCLYDGDTGRFRTRPDIIIRQDDRVAMIIDTKWKRMTPRIDDPKQGVSQADVYQLMAYSQLYNCQNVMLLYPHHGALARDPILQRFTIAKRDGDEMLFVATLNLGGTQRDHRTSMLQMVDKCLGTTVALKTQGEDLKGVATLP